MDIQDDKRPLTAEEKEAHRIIGGLNNRLEQLHKDLENLYSGKGPEPPPPFSFGANRGMDFRTRETLRLNKEMRAVREQADRELDELVDKTPGRTKYHVHQIVDHHRNPNKTLSEREKEIKDLSSSQDLAMSHIAEAKNKKDERTTDKKEDNKAKEPIQLERGPEPPINRFTHSLSFTQKYTLGDRNNREIKSKEKDKDIDRDDR